MIKEIWYEYLKQSRRFLFLFLWLVLGTILALYWQRRQVRTNEKKAEEILSSIDNDKNISYISQKQLKQLLKLESLEPATKGRIYQLLAEISYLSDEKYNYNNYAASAIYYFKKADSSEQMITIYSEYLGRLYENSGFDAAKQFLEQQNNDHPVSQYKDKKSTVNYYLGYADVEEMRGDYLHAKEMLKQARDYLEQIKTDSHYQHLLAKYHILQARLSLLQGHIKQARNILASYHEDDTLGLPKGNMFVYCDFTLPYHELMGKILLLQGKEKKAIHHIDLYLDGCNESCFYMMQYRMLKFMLAEHSDCLSSKNYLRYQWQFIRLSDDTIKYLSRDYCDGLLQHLIQEQDQLLLQEKQNFNHRALIYATLFLLYALVIIWGVVRFCLLYAHTDSLTHLEHRSRYERTRNCLERHKSPYSLLLLDMDDYEKITDTYGQEAGNCLLRQIASIVKAQLQSQDTAYRYGEKEICVVLRETTMEEVQQIAENIRLEILHFPWKSLIPDLLSPLSVSGGLADAPQGKNPFRQADYALYYAREHGKNQIACYRDICR